MGDITDFDALRRAMAENSEQPEGPARNARAEQLLADAERLDVPPAVIEALGHQLKVYNYSSEKDKMFVPFARLLRMWDERPENFDAYEAHSLHWVFKWMSAGMLDQPHVPLASIEKWLAEMAHRYRLAGHSERAVRSAEFSVAAHIGDHARAERAYAAWLAADRDEMADCHACELHGQGDWQVTLGRDAQALELWQPVLEGEFACAHEPHTVLASSLAPLLRLERVDEARANHLRGFRLVRTMESMRSAYADHVEFCALTGNEARGLELLAERPAYFTDTGHPCSRLDFMAVVTLLMDRLTELGLDGRQVPGPAGRSWTAGELAVHARAQTLELAERFDRRNGTSYVGERARARMAQRPLVGRLPLGVRTVRTAPAPAAPPPAPAACAATDLAALLAEARRLSQTLQPHALQAWAAVAQAAQGAELEPRDRAEITDHEAMARGPEGIELFERAAVLYAQAGDPGEALAARARGAYVRALTGEVDTALTTVTGLYDEILALYADEGTGVRQTASVVMSRARVLMRRVHDGAVLDRPAPDGTVPEGAGPDRAAAGRGEAGPVPDGAVPGPWEPGEPAWHGSGPAAADSAARSAAAERAVREVLALVDGRCADDVRLAARAAEARAMLAELAGLRGDAGQAAELFRRAACDYVDAGLAWFAVEYEVQVAALAQQAGDLAGAERALRRAVEHGGPYVEPVGRAQLHLQLAEVIGGRGESVEAAEHALQAAHWADEAGESGTLGAWARQQLGGFLLRQGRCAEAAEVLESALADLSARTHGDGAVVQALWWLGDCLSELDDHRAAAERRLQAAEIARHWPEQQDHATLAHLAAESLGHAGLPAEAEQAYARAGELWRSLGNPHFLVRSLRARAWLALRGESGTEGARELMVQAVHTCESALQAAADPVAREQLTAELGATHRQFGDLLARSATEEAEDGVIQAAFEAALVRMERAVALFGSLGADGLHSRTGAELAAGWLEADLGRPAEAAARARAVLAAYEDAGDEDETVRQRRAEAAQMLEPDQ
ncbi:tetratricopeptide repeat protein [Streptomyces broussonetiae]|uniref:Tetratricopeptide repeat protein n=1 Tax=Streptomyces broussonetiae TaxID=2686304 RepID=A0A6I6N8T0_9ACTN|nr:tetratricopeptide repeat protein [Streptomyces broussonetiae]QHA07069.1 tetratricopeptide repeat protein [Streptomyces broussonetiae]